jgi:hypothetical protein
MIYDRVCFTSLFPAFPRSDFMSVLPQITYGNVTLIFLSYFHGYNKNEILNIYSVTNNYVLFRTWNLGQHFLDISRKNEVNQALLSLINDNY